MLEQFRSEPRKTHLVPGLVDQDFLKFLSFARLMTLRRMSAPVA